MAASPEGEFGALERLVLGLWSLCGRRSRRSLGPEYAAELDETLRLRLRDSRRLSPMGRLRFIVAEGRALLRVGLRSTRRGAVRRPGTAGPEHSLPRSLIVDLGLAARQLRRSPAHALTAVGILALAIGANAALFSVVHAVLIRPLPYPEPERLVRVSLENPGNRFNASVADFLALRAEANGLENVVAMTRRGSTYYPQSFTITLTDDPDRPVVAGTWITAGYFAALGVEPVLGRDVAAGEDDVDAEPVVVVSHDFWQQRLGGRSDVLEATVQINDLAHRVIGVMPAGFHEPWDEGAMLWPAFRLQEPGRRGPFFLNVLARLPGGQTRALSQATLEPLAGDVFDRWSDSFGAADTRYVLSPLHEEIAGRVREMLWLLFAAVGLLLAIALANVANLVLARALARRREFALRAALGASRGRLLAQLLAEGLCLSIGGAVAGLIAGAAMLRLLLAGLAEPLPRQAEIGLDGTVVGFAAAVSALIVVALTLLPARGLSAGRGAPSLRQGGRHATDDATTGRLRSLLVFGEVALAVPLLVGAVLTVVTLAQLQRADPGFDGDRILTMRVALPLERYETLEQVLADLVGLADVGARVPGIEATSLSSSLPPSRLWQRNNFIVRDLPLDPGAAQPVAHYMSITPGYFSTLGVRLLAGRDFGSADGADGAPVAIVDRAFADRFLQGQAIGRQLQFGGCTQCPWSTVVGVAGDVRYDGLERDHEPTVYVPVGQDLQPVMYLSARAAGDPAAPAATVRAAVLDIVPGAAVTEVRTARRLLDETVDAPRQRAWILGLLAALGVLLAAVGVYGVVAGFVARSSREIGLRMAVGATRGSVVRLVLARAARPLGAGLLVGLGLALAAARFMEGVVHGVAPRSPVVLLGALALLAIVALSGTLVPARRASRIDPVDSLRAE